MLEGGAPVARQTRRLLDTSISSTLRENPVSHPAANPLFYSTGDLRLLESAVQRYLHLNEKTLGLQVG
jgi:hypothetical protein